MILFETIKPKLFEILPTEPAFSTGVYRDEWASCLKEKKIFENSPSEGGSFILQGERSARGVCGVCARVCVVCKADGGHMEGTQVPWAHSGTRSQLLVWEPGSETAGGVCADHGHLAPSPLPHPKPGCKTSFPLALTSCAWALFLCYTLLSCCSVFKN